MKLLHRVALFYLLLPFALFALGWLRLMFAIPLLILLIWTFYQLNRAIQSPISNPQSPFTVPSFLLLLLWVFFSGIGGYAFQNWDHNWRNAVFHDLINYPHPVVYAAPEVGPIKALVYYLGYWLPAAWVGKAFGWRAANFALFLWTLLGVVLVVSYVSRAIRVSSFQAALLLIFFSGMDALGVLLRPSEYPTLFPPFRHLEVWMTNLQYSSFTTQLFWVFNQAVPAWLCFLLALTDRRIEVKILAGALCFFFAPLVAVGFFFYLLLDLIEELRARGGAFFKETRWDAVFAAFLIFSVSFLYFSSNTAAQTRGFSGLPLSQTLLFFLLEGGILWLLLAPLAWREPRWQLTGALLLLTPFFRVGVGSDFVMRASIVPLFYLMLKTGETLQAVLPRFQRAAIFAVLLVGALTPLYEINRSVYHTAQYYFFMDESERAASASEPALEFEKVSFLEYENPKSLAADEIYSLAKLRNKLAKNFVANPRQSFYYKYLAPH